MLAFPSPKWARLTPSQKEAEAKVLRQLAGGVASPIIPGLYLSDYFIARDNEELSKVGITHVISIMEGKPAIPPSITPERKLHIPLADSMDADLLSQLEKTNEFIRLALAENGENKVLVHCAMGISRSPTVVCAYLIATRRMTGPEAIEFVRTKRGIVSPNLNFRLQLDKYAAGFVVDKSKQGREGPLTRLSERLNFMKAMAAKPSSPTSDSESQA